jgi:hypothetical protein
VTVAGVRFGPIDAIFAVSALLIITGGLAMIGPLSKATTAGEATQSAGPRPPGPQLTGHDPAPAAPQPADRDPGQTRGA